jgi:hypothetical protein
MQAVTFPPRAFVEGQSKDCPLKNLNARCEAARALLLRLPDAQVDEVVGGG